MTITAADHRLVVEAQREELRAMRPARGGPDLPRVLRTLARAHLGLALLAPDRRTATAEAWRAADVLEVVIEIGRRAGEPTGDLFLDDAYRESFVPLAIGRHAWTTSRAWLEALEVAVWSGRTEVVDALPRAGDRMLRAAEPLAVARLAETFRLRVTGAPDDGAEGPYSALFSARRQLPKAGAFAPYLAPRIDAWTAVDGGKVAALDAALLAIADEEAGDPEALTSGLGFSLSASAIFVFAQTTGVRASLVDPRVRRLPAT